MKRPARQAAPPPVEVHVRQQDILSAEADALGCLVTPSLEPDDDASRRIFAATASPAAFAARPRRPPPRRAAVRKRLTGRGQRPARGPVV